MDDDPPAHVVTSLRTSSAPQPSTTDADPCSSSASAPPTTSSAAPKRRLRFYVQLNPDETTIVSWKKLLKGATAPTPPAGPHPVLQTRIVPPTATPAAAEHQPIDRDPIDEQQPSTSKRFSTVIHKIQRLYTGKDTTDEEQLHHLPDDGQNDSQDSFIDDAELNDYFRVDKSATKHQGFFVSKGNLERIESSRPSNLASKKRGRKDPVIKLPGEKFARRVPTEFVSTGSVRMKDAARKASLIGKRPPATLSTVSTDHSSHRYHKDAKETRDRSTVLLDVPTTKPQSSSPTVPDLQSTSLPRKEIAQSFDTTMDLQKPNLGAPSNTSKFAPKTSHLINGQINVTTVSSVEDNTSLANDMNGTVELPDLNYPGTAYPMLTTTKMPTTMRPKGSALDRAINDLEKSVATCKPSMLVVRQGDDNTSQVVRKRLPVQVKQKLAKVARLANNRGKITSDQFLDRLMGILGHLVQPATLKRHLKEMVEVGLTVKQAKVDKFQQIKKQVSEMIKVRLNASKAVGQQTGSSEDFLDPLNNNRIAAANGIDEAVEDKIYALYDLYVEGMDEDIGPQSRKLYVELADLWPAGYMDAVGIKDVIHRARRRRHEAYKQSKVKHEEGIKRQIVSCK